MTLLALPFVFAYYVCYGFVVATSAPFTVSREALGCSVNNAYSSDNNSDDGSLLFKMIKSERHTSTVEWVAYFLRGGHYDITDHYPKRKNQMSPQPHAVELNHSAQQKANHPKHQHCDHNHFASPPYPPGTWERYLRATNYNAEEAQKRLSETLQWRLDQGIDSILTLPHPYFDAIKQFYPHAFHLHGYNNEPVYFEFPAKIDLRAMREKGMTLDDLLRHYALITEFMWTYISPYQNGPSSRGITVIDLDGLRLQDFVGEAVTFVKRAAFFTSRHYPERCEAIYIVNSPPFFQVFWKMIKPILDPVTIEKVRVVESSKNDNLAIRKALAERIPMENIPREYGGASKIPLGYSPQEQLLRDLMNHNNFHLSWDMPMGMPQHGPGCWFCNRFD